ncbi:hypothetical protein NC653_031372 [Populus alba x Populus x berolinensis]|uniref:Uncharacterized protein n=1 Tax=Populus alba x Populus x berolinensis TaxID=444605 RepID=A0AAD6LYC3_9ROSI|nr:hypothetical protein NC653_031372 [Populus alba x Populus x berolinensis]
MKQLLRCSKDENKIQSASDKKQVINYLVNGVKSIKAQVCTLDCKVASYMGWGKGQRASLA